MIYSNRQKDIQYFKEYPCYSTAPHPTQDSEQQFSNVSYIKFTNQTCRKQQLPLYFIDNCWTPSQIYSLHWTNEELDQSRFESKINIIGSQSLNQALSRYFSESKSQMKKRKYRCLYLSLLGEKPYTKLVFNYDPEIVAICQNYIYTFGAKQLIVTHLKSKHPAPQLSSTFQKCPLSSQLSASQPSHGSELSSISQLTGQKEEQFRHQLDGQSEILSVDFVFGIEGDIMCKVIYFNQKKGIFSQVYHKDRATENSILNKIFDLSLKFKKKQQQPIFYQTLVPNILGIVIHSQDEFSLFDLTAQKNIPNTKIKLQDWKLNHHQPILIKSYQNINDNDNDHYNDCLLITIGQASNIEIFLYHILYNGKILVSAQGESKNGLESERIKLQKIPIQRFTSGKMIDFENSLLKHYTIVNLQEITHLSSYTLSKNGILYLGYSKNQLGNHRQNSQQLPITGFIEYNKPYITHQILMQQNKIWKEYKQDILLDLDTKQSYTKCFQRLLALGRYHQSFILKTLNLNKIAQLQELWLQKNIFNELSLRLFLEWQTSQKFVQFVIFKGQVLVIRKNSVGILISISEQQYYQQKDNLCYKQISYNQLLQRGFEELYDIEGQQFINEEMDDNGNLSHISNKIERSYEDKLMTINAKIRNFMDSGVLETEFLEEPQNGIAGYHDQQQIQKYSNLYQITITKLNQLSKKSSTFQLNFIQNSSRNDSVNNSAGSKAGLLIETSTLTVRLKDQLNYLTNILKTTYHYYFQKLLQSAKKKQNYQSKNDNFNQAAERSRKLNQQEGTLSLKNDYLRHMYTVFVLQWIINVFSNNCLYQQYQIFGHDFLQQFVQNYVSKLEQKNNKQNYLLKYHLDLHVDMLISLLLRGLVTEVDSFENINYLDIMIDPSSKSVHEVINSQIDKLNKESNPFILMLLKKYQPTQQQTHFIVHNIIKSLYYPLLQKTLSRNVSEFIPINKTFVYAILNLRFSQEQMSRIFCSYMQKKQFLGLMLLIQLENNCHLMIEEGIQLQMYGQNMDYFEENSLGLSKECCCILEDLILKNYKLFLFQSQIQHDDLDCQNNTQYQEKLNTQFIKSLFYNIDFMQITSALVDGTLHTLINNAKKSPSQNQNQQLYIYEQLIYQVEELNRTFRNQNIIQTVFNKFYHRIYHPKHSNPPQKKQQKSQMNPLNISQGHKLSMQELNLIQRLYDKQEKMLKLKKKHNFELTVLIQQRLNLEFAMLKIHIFRLKVGFEQVGKIVDSVDDAEQYIKVIKECVNRAKDALKLFKFWTDKFNQKQQTSMTDQECLERLIQIDRMENSDAWKQSSEILDQTTEENDWENEQWSILGRPVSEAWLTLLQLTFSDATIYNKLQSHPKTKIIFKNYHSQNSILMKILIVICQEKLFQEYQTLIDLFGAQKIHKIIQGNPELKTLYDRRYGNQYNPELKMFQDRQYGNQQNSGLYMIYDSKYGNEEFICFQNQSGGIANSKSTSYRKGGY